MVLLLPPSRGRRRNDRSINRLRGSGATTHRFCNAFANLTVSQRTAMLRPRSWQCGHSSFGLQNDLARQPAQDAAAEALYIRSRIDPTKPIAFFGIVNERCNVKCRYCAYWRLDHYVEEMD